MQTCLFYIELIHDITGRKNISMICKDLISWVKKTSLTKEVAVFSFNIFDENIAKLVGDM